MSEQHPIRIMCPKLSCRSVLSVPETTRGKVVRCKECGANVRIPSADAKTGGQSSPQPAEGKA